MKRTADEILKMLAEKHARDVFVPECKSGPTWCGAPIRLDAWAMKRSWARPAFWGYEIKVSRSDFLADDKWRDYLEHCNQFYFVAPPDVIKPEELPPEAGLMLCSRTGSRLYRKKKAPIREIEISTDVLVYVLMSRATIDECCKLTYGEPRTRGDRLAYWQQWLEDRELGHDLGWRVSRALREEIENRVREAELRAKRAESEMEQLAEASRTLQELGITSNGIFGTRRTIEAALDKIGPERELQRAISAMQKALTAIQDAKAKTQEQAA